MIRSTCATNIPNAFPHRPIPHDPLSYSLPLPPHTISSFHPTPLAPPLKPATRPQYRHALIHNPLAHAQIIVDPPLQFLAIGYLLRVDAGAMVPGRVGVLSASLVPPFQMMPCKGAHGHGSNSREGKHHVHREDRGLVRGQVGLRTSDQ